MNEQPRDAHLLAALRHAPDRDAAPPPEVTARILAAARKAVRPSGPHGLQRAWAWFASPRMGAAFATLVVAVLVGVMWSSQEPPLPASAAPEAPRDGGEASAQRVETPASVSAPPPAAAPTTTVAPPPPGERRVAKAQTQRLPQSRSSDRAPPPATMQENRERESPPPVATPAPAPVPAATESLARADAVAAAPPAARQRTESAAAQAGALAAKQAAAPPRLAGGAASFDPLLALEAGGDAGWSWSAAGVGERAHGAAQRELWAAMRAATQSRWDAAPSAPATVPWLVLRDGPRRSAFRLVDGSLHVTDADGRTWRAPLAPEQARDWQQAVARW